MLRIGLDSAGAMMLVAALPTLSKTIGTIMNIYQSIESDMVMDVMREMIVMKVMAIAKGVVGITAEEEIRCSCSFLTFERWKKWIAKKQIRLSRR